jgi:hypothetical protein
LPTSPIYKLINKRPIPLLKVVLFLIFAEVVTPKIEVTDKGSDQQYE